MAAAAAKVIAVLLFFGTLVCDFMAITPGCSSARIYHAWFGTNLNHSEPERIWIGRSNVGSAVSYGRRTFGIYPAAREVNHLAHTELGLGVNPGAGVPSAAGGRVTPRIPSMSIFDMARQPTGLGYLAMRAANAIDPEGSAPSRSHTPPRLRCTSLPYTEATLLTSTASVRPGRRIRQHKLFGVTIDRDGFEIALFACHPEDRPKSL
jgi:hypothetical protein